MTLFKSLVSSIDQLSLWIGKACGWLILLMMGLTSLVVILRYGFNQGSVALQESVTYLHALVFLGAAAMTLKQEGHVRVDIFYRRFSPEQQAWVNALGGIILLLPICLFTVFISWNFVASSWAIREGSPNADGIEAVYWLKTMIPVAFGLLGIQGIAEVLRSLSTLLKK